MYTHEYQTRPLERWRMVKFDANRNAEPSTVRADSLCLQAAREVARA